MRTIVHDTMALPCWRIPFVSGAPTLVRGRLHTARLNQTNGAMGDLESQGYAQREEIHPKIIFRRDEVDPKRNDIFVFAPDEAYTVQPERPFDDITVTVKVVRMEQVEVAALLAAIVPPLEFWPV